MKRKKLHLKGKNNTMYSIYIDKNFFHFVSCFVWGLEQVFIRRDCCSFRSSALIDFKQLNFVSFPALLFPTSFFLFDSQITGDKPTPFQRSISLKTPGGLPTNDFFFPNFINLDRDFFPSCRKKVISARNSNDHKIRDRFAKEF